ncbi:hypothetical protein MAR_001453 [Mya arenaria]|uniref:Cysteine and tyrosine-rich protein 1 n=1 Tax=Mya arenaria TaxID=6604 RepID=A0ABY7FBW0_MYAAR|nr:uncharacterized protein LOC128209319 isoform X2 [Mya arenaria]WAR19615.1 hypothetical protein MAR_001453 [Mya arenaria]
MEGVLLFSTLVAVICFHGADAGEYCVTSSYGLKWCEWGCCDYRKCCEDTGVGAIVGIVVGCVIFVAIVVGVIVAIVCCVRKSRGRQGQVVQNNQASSAVVQNPPPYPNQYPLASPAGHPAGAQTQWPQHQHSAGTHQQNWQQQPEGTNQQWQQQPAGTNKQQPY